MFILWCWIMNKDFMYILLYWLLLLRFCMFYDNFRFWIIGIYVVWGLFYVWELLILWLDECRSEEKFLYLLKLISVFMVMFIVCGFFVFLGFIMSFIIVFLSFINGLFKYFKCLFFVELGYEDFFLLICFW